MVEPIAFDAVHSYNPLCISFNGKKAIKQLPCRSRKPILFPINTSCLVLLSSYLLQLHTGGGLDTRGHSNDKWRPIFSDPIVSGLKLSGTCGESA